VATVNHTVELPMGELGVNLDDLQYFVASVTRSVDVVSHEDVTIDVSTCSADEDQNALVARWTD
jgi:hypothetical protein